MGLSSFFDPLRIARRALVGALKSWAVSGELLGTSSTKIIGLRQGCSLFWVNHSSASRNLGHRFIEQWNTGEADGESALQPSSLFCHTHTAYAAVARDTTAATAGAVDGIVDPASSIRHRRLRHRPSRGRGAYQAGEGAPYP
eukprot:scaffold2622_cov32-Phaeocystis_antarctica.AAC.3